MHIGQMQPTDAAAPAKVKKGKVCEERRKKIIMLIKCDDHKSSLWQLKSALNAPPAADSAYFFLA